jgi:uncharacterized delta-60 repeat protein
VRGTSAIAVVALSGMCFAGGAVSASASGATHPGDLDATFASQGRFSVGNDPDSIELVAQAFTAGGSVIEAGMGQRRTQSGYVYPVVFKLAPTGQLDPTFGTAGRVDIPTDPYPYMDSTATRLDRRGRILLGISGSQATPGQYFSGVARLKPNGALDTGFGQQGMAVVDLPSSPDFIRENADGSIDVVSNWGSTEITIVRFDKYGVPVPTFGSGGIVTLWPLTHQPAFSFNPGDLGDGTTLLFEQSTPAIRRVLADGSYDPNFGTGGVMRPTTPVRPLGSDGKGLEVLSRNASNQAVVQRVLANGTFDPAFGPAGSSVTISDPAAQIVAHHGPYFYGVIRQTDGNDIVRFTAGGQQDLRFGDAGSHLLPKPAGADYYYPMNVAFDGFNKMYVQQLATFGYVNLIEVMQSDVYRMIDAAAQVNVSSTTLHPGDGFTLSGRGFGSSETASVRLGGQSLGTAPTQPDGTIPSTTETVPATVAPGAYSLTVTGTTSGLRRSVALTIVA